jgi:hypothetical protein
MSKPAAIAKGIAFAFPDVCLTPAPPAPPVPIPYPNIAQLDQAQPVSDAGGKELLVGSGGDHALLLNGEISSSSGDEAGSVGGVVSHIVQGKCILAQGSLTVLYGPEGRGLVRFLDQTQQNVSPANLANAQGVVLSAVPTVLVGD